MKLASRLARLKPSLTLAVAAKAAKMRSEGADIIAFGVGEPDFDTPDSIKSAVLEALARGLVGKYTAVAGTAELRAAAASELNRVHGTRHTTETVIVSVGAKHSLFNLFMALLEDGDEVVIPTPCWVSYPELVQMAGGRAVLLETRPEDGYRLDEERLERSITPRTRAVVINSPCNPTGAVYDQQTLLGIGRVLERHPEVLLVTDDIYRRLVYGVEWHSIGRVCPDLGERLILVDGVSKSYAMTGWRIGFCAGPKELVAAMTTLQSQSTTNPSAIAQAAALAALTGPQETVEAMRLEFDRRRRRMVERLRAIPSVRLHEPTGAFYCFPDLSAYVGGKIKDDIALADFILERGRVALVPGSGFHAPGFARLSYATSLAQVEEGTARLAGALAEIT